MRKSICAAAVTAALFGFVTVGSAPSPAAAASGAAGTFTPLSPVRILDTRDGTGGFNTPFAPNQIRDLTVTGKGGVPASGVDAVAVNVTAVAPSAGGWLTVFPSGTSLPNSSSLNFVANQTVPNLVVVKVGRGGVNEGKVSIANTRVRLGTQPAAGTVHVIVDVVGWYSDGTTASAARFTGLTPNRILDTRTNVGLSGAFAPNQIRNLTVTGGAVPATADAVVLNVTVTQPSAAGFLTLYPAGQAPPPLASNLNFVAGQTVANLAVVEVGANGQVAIANTAVASGPPPAAGTVHVIADVVGYYEPNATGSSFSSIAPLRILDTRSGSGVPVAANATITLDPSVAGLPPAGSYTGVVVNVTVTGPTNGGWLTVYPSDATLPLASNLNFTAGNTLANLVKVAVGADGQFKIANTRVPSNPQPGAGTVHVVVDVVGYYTSPSQAIAASPCGGSGAAPAVYDHVVWIWMENHQRDQVIENAEAPYETSLARQCGSATDYEEVGSPSLPNYIGATSGSTQGIADDAPPAAHPLTVDNLFRQVRAKGLTERSYDEGMPSNCTLFAVGQYAERHNPATYYTGGTDRAACQADDVPLGTLQSGALRDDLDDGTLPAFAFITPDLCNDTHDCPVATGDTWLHAWIPAILAGATGRTAIFLVWDEDTRMPFVAIAPTVPTGTVVSSRVDHYALLRTTEEMLGITSYLGAATTAPSMRAPFGL